MGEKEKISIMHYMRQRIINYFILQNYFKHIMLTEEELTFLITYLYSNVKRFLDATCYYIKIYKGNIEDETYFTFLIF